MPRLAARRLAFLGLTTAIVSGLWWRGGVSVQAQQPPKVFLSVVDRGGAPVANLQPGEVKLVLDGNGGANRPSSSRSTGR